ncbi:hypothetical protein B0T25DRAFT_147369 [Lasiosphaeria hispida]|uniref:Regulator of chromosome condensation-like protein n=1 Tax=Lasiosphaeria hispida TaxID=260671 RepID=A0AAJ0HLJ5_9PEZI|nr:hypothetical protein B0T25DRAFT_147369 [Lasiosphaeria hispida]
MAQSGNRSQPPSLYRYRGADDERTTTTGTTGELSRAGELSSEELSRAVERFHRNIDLIRHNISIVSSDPSMSGSDRELRRRFNRDPEPPTEGRNANIFPPGLPPLRHRANMASGGPGSRGNRHREHVLERHRAVLENRAVHLANLDEDNRALDNANSHLRALLDLTNNPTMLPLVPPAMSPPLQAQDHTEDYRRIKRRKLDSDKIAPSFKGVRYGVFGQVEPGPLTMEIVSCDGGLYSDESSYVAENILRNDPSVYCTKGNRCNIVLRHHGATVFSLKELVIKAPGSNYSSPVREGMVFVSMNSDELLTRTAQYQIQYLPSRANPSGSLPTIHSIRYDEDAPRIRPRRSARERHLAGERLAVPHNLDDDDEDYRTAQIPIEFNVSPPPFSITTECSDDHSGDEAGHSVGYLRSYRRTPNRIGSLPFESDNSDDSGDPWAPSQTDWSDITRLRYSSGVRGDHPMTLEEAQEASQIATQEAVRAVGGELMTPLARFHIEKDKNKCTISFDPPVSGRFILLKMWSPHHDPSKNIDIQAVIAKGFAGPRYFPSVDLL